VARISIWVRAGAARDSLAWDPWRRRWVVSCRTPPVQGAANRRVLALVQHWLGVSPGSIRWARSGTSPAKVLEVDQLTDDEVERRLHDVAAEVGNRNPPSVEEGT